MCNSKHRHTCVSWHWQQYIRSEKDRTEVLVLKLLRWTFVSTDRSGTEKVLEAHVYEYSHLSSYLFEVDGCTPLIILRNIRTIR